MARVGAITIDRAAAAMRMLARALAVCCMLASLAPPPALASEAPAPGRVDEGDGAMRHDGFLLRFSLGIGYGHLTGYLEADADADPRTIIGRTGPVTLEGGALAMVLDVGGALSDSWTLHGRMSGRGMRGRNSDLDAAITTGYFGLLSLGLTHFLMPFNAYLGATLGLADLSVFSAGDTRFTHLGLGGTVDLGKEWWVADNWGLGGVLRAWLAWAPAEPADANLVAFELAFTATYQ